MSAGTVVDCSRRVAAGRRLTVAESDLGLPPSPFARKSLRKKGKVLTTQVRAVLVPGLEVQDYLDLMANLYSPWSTARSPGGTQRIVVQDSGSPDEVCPTA